MISVAGGAIWLSAPREEQDVDFHATKAFVYGQGDASRFLRRAGIEVEAVKDIRRNGSASELFIYLFDNYPNRHGVIRVTTNGLTHLSAPGPRAVPGPDGRFVVWLGERGNIIHFANGYVLEIPRFALFAVDPSATYFVVAERPRRAWLGRVGAPSDKVIIANDLIPHGVFVTRKRVYVTGHSYKGYSSDLNDPVATCLILEDDGKSFGIVERVTFAWAGSVVEVDPFSDRLLLWSTTPMSKAVYTYDLETRQRDKVGRVEGFQFFLVNDLLQ